MQTDLVGTGKKEPDFSKQRSRVLFTRILVNTGRAQKRWPPPLPPPPENPPPPPLRPPPPPPDERIGLYTFDVFVSLDEGFLKIKSTWAASMTS